MLDYKDFISMAPRGMFEEWNDQNSGSPHVQWVQVFVMEVNGLWKCIHMNQYCLLHNTVTLGHIIVLAGQSIDFQPQRK